MSLPPQKTLAQYNTDFVNAYVAGLAPSYGVVASAIPTGDPIRAIGGSVAPQAVYLQGLVYDLIEYARASTATGSDLDSWLADFGYTRPQGSAATAVVTFSTATGLPAAAAIPILAGTTVLTGPITVGPSTTPTNYAFTVSAVQAAGVLFQISAGQASVTLNCTAVAIGSIYNFIPSTTALNFQIPVSGAGNPVLVSVSGGVDSASDAQARADFVNFIQSLSSATKAAIITAIQDASASLIYGTNFVLTDANLNAGTTPGGPIPLCPTGMIYVIIANPSNLAGGYDSTSANAQAALNAVLSAEAFGINAAVYDCAYYVIFSIYIAMSVSSGACVAAGISTSQVQALATTAITNYINNLGIGQSIVWSTLIQLLRNVSAVTATGATVTNIITDVGITPSTGTGIVVVNTPAYTPSVYDTVPPGNGPNSPTDQYGVLRTSQALSSPPYTTSIQYNVTLVA